MADIWAEIFKVAVPALSSIAGGLLSGEGSRRGTDAQADAAEAAALAQLQAAREAAARNEPWRRSGVGALNFQNAWLGLPQVATDYAPTSGGSGSGAFGAYNPADWGAGKLVAGHSGGGPSGLATGLGNAAGTGIGTMFGGPIGGAIGGALGSAVGGMFRQSGPKGDNWETLGTSAPAGYDYEEYFASDPGLATEWAKADVRSLFNNNRDAYLWWHANGGTDPKTGKQQWTPNTGWLDRGRAASGGGSPNIVNRGDGTFGVGADGQGLQIGGSGQAGGGQQDIWTSIKNNPLWTAATEGFLKSGMPAVNAAFGAGGKALSGAQKIALQDNAIGKWALPTVKDIYNQYAGISGTGANVTQATNQTNMAATTNAGNARMSGANALASGYNDQWKGIGDGISGAFGALQDYGKSNWGWA